MKKQFSYRIAFLFFILFFWLIKPVKSQEPCGTMQVLKEQLKNDPGMQKRMDESDKQIKKYDTNPQLLTDDLVVIPVVVHVIYHTAAQNISKAQIESQIAVLNEDFMRQNADTVNTPAVFKGRAANINLQFALAIRDPNGEATSGITRTYTDKTTFSGYTEMKNWNSDTGGHAAWPATDYLNVWICNLDGLGIRGFATFPDALDDVDGIVVEPDAFGRGSEFNLASNYNLGRTGTHEVGHWLRLSHTWGDGGCNIDDGIGDTPSAGAPNWIDTPCTFPGPNSCSRIEPDGVDHPDMFQNYMDYSNDQCMNLFTEGQKSLMRKAFDTRGSRVSIRNSLGLTSPINCNELTLNFKYDEHPEDISWTITNKSTNDTVAVGKKYETPPFGFPAEATEDVYNLCLADGDYTFTIVDAYADGMPEGDYNLISRYETLHVSDGDFGAGESFDFTINDRYYRFVGPGTDWNDDANWNRKVPSTFAEFGKITIESDCIKKDGLEITPPNILQVKHGLTFSATARDSKNDTIHGLVAHYLFNGNADDETGNGFNGIIDGATPAADKFGNIQKALSFDGNDFVRIPDLYNATTQPLENVTYSLWFKPYQNYGVGDFYSLIIRTTDAGFTDMIGKPNFGGGVNGEFQFYMYNGNLNFSKATTIEFLANQWYHVVATRDNDTMKIYLNSAKEGEVNYTSPPSFYPDLYLGGHETANRWYFNGALDDLRIYDRALTDAEIQEIYNWEKPSKNSFDSGLMAHFPFNGNANDETGNSKTVAVNGPTLTTDRFGNVDKAYAFDGINDMIRVTQTSKLSDISRTTISFWANHNQVTRTTDAFDWQAYISKDTPGKWFTSMLCTNPTACNGDQPLTFYTPGLSKTDTRYNWSTVSPNVWYYITLSNDGTTSKIYVNGTIVKSENVTGSITTNTSDIILGRCLTGSLYPLDGKLDDVRIYNRALSDAEVTALYNAEKP
jgi:hypothetical protein